MHLTQRREENPAAVRADIEKLHMVSGGGKVTLGHDYFRPCLWRRKKRGGGGVCMTNGHSWRRQRRGNRLWQPCRSVALSAMVIEEGNRLQRRVRGGSADVRDGVNVERKRTGAIKTAAMGACMWQQQVGMAAGDWPSSCSFSLLCFCRFCGSFIFRVLHLLFP